MADISKSAQKNKKRREKKKVNETTDLEVGKDKDEEPAPVVKELNPVELIKQKIEEAKLSKDHKKAQQLREQLWALQDQAAGRTVKDAPEIDPTLFQTTVKPQSKPKVEVVNDESNDKRLKQLRKKLDQITKLKEKQEKGETLEQNQLAKLATEQDVLDEISAIEDVYKQLTLR